MAELDIKELNELVEDFRITYCEKNLNASAPATAEDIHELSRDVFYVLKCITENLEALANKLESSSSGN